MKRCEKKIKLNMLRIFSAKRKPKEQLLMEDELIIVVFRLVFTGFTQVANKTTRHLLLLAVSDDVSLFPRILLSRTSGKGSCWCAKKEPFCVC